MIRRITSHSVLTLALGFSLAACENTAAPGADATVVLSGGVAASQSLAMTPLFSLSGGETLASVPVGSVSAVNVTIKAVHALPANRDEANEAAWVALDVQQGGSIDLLNLSEAGVEIAREELEPGTYVNVRLFVENASITFSEPVTVGSGPTARTYAVGEAHPLRIPSGEQTGIKVPTAGFVVTENFGGVATLVFDAGASVQSIQAVPSGVQMSPVLTSRSN